MDTKQVKIFKPCLVNYKTISKLAKALIKSDIYENFKNFKNASELAVALHELNKKAIKKMDIYVSDNEFEPFKFTEYEITFNEKSREQFLKSLSYYLAQCEFADLENEELFIKLFRIWAAFASLFGRDWPDE